MPSMFKKYNSAVALLQLLSIGGALAHPGGMPRLMGRSGYIDLQDLPDRLVKRAVSTDGTCGGTKGFTCGTTTNKCCSQYGWCGDSTAHCLTGCQPAFGTCTGVTTTTPPVTGTTTTTAATTNPTIPATNGRGTCGSQNQGAGCPAGQCCSAEGICGTGYACVAPDCQIGFGKCDADIVPAGGSTSGVARTKVGNVLYGGEGVYNCVTPGTIALTYDDGPYIYTQGIVDKLNAAGAKATFFVTGVNYGKGAIDTTPAWNTVIKNMYNNGHQLASHTWSHADLSTLTEARRKEEMYKLEMAMRNIVGFFPTYMRPPYSSCNAACQATMAELGYHIIYFDLDTDDYNNDSPTLIQNSRNNFNNKVGPSNSATTSWLEIGHDIHEQTAINLTQYMLDTLKAKGYRAVTVGECLGDPVANWYRSAGTIPVPSSSSVPPASSSTIVPPVSSTSSTSVVPPASSTSSTPPASTGTCPGTSPYHVKTWCVTPLPTYTTTAKCWDTVGNCYDQGDVCWNTVADAFNAACGTYHEQVCAKQEVHCQECADAGAINCAFLTPTYPASVN